MTMNQYTPANEILPVKSKPKRNSKGKFIGSKPKTLFLKLCEMELIYETSIFKYISCYVNEKKAILGQNIDIDIKEYYQPKLKHWWSSSLPSLQSKLIRRKVKIIAVDSGVREALFSLFPEVLLIQHLPPLVVSPETKEEIKKITDNATQVGGSGSYSITSLSK